ncbi:MAG: DNA/RNA non-specific endonuclease [Gammaproteobacteria bacterium]
MQQISLTVLLSLLLVSGGAPVAMENLTIAHCLQGCPTGTAASNEIVVRHLYAVSINQQTRMADWVSYRILPQSIGVASLLPRRWNNDQLAQNSVRVEELGTGAATDTLQQPVLGNQPESVYRITEFTVQAGDQGRLVPMTSFAGTGYWNDLNLVSVMSLMRSDLRLGAWSRLDQAVNALVRSDGELFVIAGPVYQFDGTLPEAGSSSTPTAFFKVVANQAGAVAAFLFDQDLPIHASFCAQHTELDTVAEAAGLALFPAATEWPLSGLGDRLGC